MGALTIIWCLSIVLFEITTVKSTVPPKSDVIHLTDGIDVGGMWKSSRKWKSHWVKHWETRQIWIPVWKKVWAPVEMQEWLPLPPPPKTKHAIKSFH